MKTIVIITVLVLLIGCLAPTNGEGRISDKIKWPKSCEVMLNSNSTQAYFVSIDYEDANRLSRTQVIKVPPGGDFQEQLSGGGGGCQPRALKLYKGADTETSTPLCGIQIHVRCPAGPFIDALARDFCPIQGINIKVNHRTTINEVQLTVEIYGSRRGFIVERQGCQAPSP